MKKSTLRLFVLLTPFVAGSLLGFLAGNPNASDNSAHCYGTTFDISYTRYFREKETDEFMQPFELTKVLGEVLRDHRNAGKILVKYEKKEHCFHITVR